MASSLTPQPIVITAIRLKAGFVQVVVLIRHIYDFLYIYKYYVNSRTEVFMRISRAQALRDVILFKAIRFHLSESSNALLAAHSSLDDDHRIQLW